MQLFCKHESKADIHLLEVLTMQRGTWPVCYEKPEVSNTSKGEERGDGTYFEWVNHADSTVQSLEIF